MSALAKRATGGTLLALAGLHVAWGCGSAFPFKSGQDLAEAVVGGQEVPPPTACFAVAAALLLGGVLVHDVPHTPDALRRTGLLAMAGVFGTRAALGWAGKTDLVSPGSNSARFRRLDKRMYSPLCAALAAGSVSARS
jgi:hypothetical protein